MMSLPEFLLARLDEDEREARKRIQSGEGKGTPRVNPSPARVLADVEAKRRIVELHRPFSEPATDYDCMGCPHNTPASECPTLRLLALPYAGHEDYREEWKP